MKAVALLLLLLCYSAASRAFPLRRHLSDDEAGTEINSAPTTTFSSTEATVADDEDANLNSNETDEEQVDSASHSGASTTTTVEHHDETSSQLSNEDNEEDDNDTDDEESSSEEEDVSDVSDDVLNVSADVSASSVHDPDASLSTTELSTKVKRGVEKKNSYRANIKRSVPEYYTVQKTRDSAKSKRGFRNFDEFQEVRNGESSHEEEEGPSNSDETKDELMPKIDRRNATGIIFSTATPDSTAISALEEQNSTVSVSGTNDVTFASLASPVRKNIPEVVSEDDIAVANGYRPSTIPFYEKHKGENGAKPNAIGGPETTEESRPIYKKVVKRHKRLRQSKFSRGKVAGKINKEGQRASKLREDGMTRNLERLDNHSQNRKIKNDVTKTGGVKQGHSRYHQVLRYVKAPKDLVPGTDKEETFPGKTKTHLAGKRKVLKDVPRLGNVDTDDVGEMVKSSNRQRSASKKASILKPRYSRILNTHSDPEYHNHLVKDKIDSFDKNVPRGHIWTNNVTVGGEATLNEMMPPQIPVGTSLSNVQHPDFGLFPPSRPAVLTDENSGEDASIKDVDKLHETLDAVVDIQKPTPKVYVSPEDMNRPALYDMKHGPGFPNEDTLVNGNDSMYDQNNVEQREGQGLQVSIQLKLRQANNTSGSKKTSIAFPGEETPLQNVNEEQLEEPNFKPRKFRLVLKPKKMTMEFERSRDDQKLIPVKQTINFGRGNMGVDISGTNSQL